MAFEREFDLTIKFIDPFSVRHITVLVDLLKKQGTFYEDDYVEALASLVETCANNLDVPVEQTTRMEVYRNAISDTLQDCAHRLMAAKRDYYQAGSN